MSKCINVTISDGSVIRVNVADGVTELDQQDIQALESYVAYVKAQRYWGKKRLVEMPCLNCHKQVWAPKNSDEAKGIFNVFCNGDCEDEYAAKQ